ncbi:MAG TPA: RimK/LysX family protein, partial [Candidatus Saccharimonadales bacterium]|nr:RimK/LysX family protein [Candidatus Saccharimonadales bacterium]
GAYTSSLDCEWMQEVAHGDQTVLEFVLLRPSRQGYTGKKHSTKDFTYTEVTNANGVQPRYIIFAPVIINGETHRARFSLSNRSKLRYPVLIGRKLIAQGNYLVDVKRGEGFPDDEEERGL